jgi:hypothetical protein
MTIISSGNDKTVLVWTFDPGDENEEPLHIDDVCELSK